MEPNILCLFWGESILVSINTSLLSIYCSDRSKNSKTMPSLFELNNNVSQACFQILSWFRGVAGESRKLSREEKRRQRRASAKYRLAHATRERMRVEVRLSSQRPKPMNGQADEKRLELQPKIVIAGLQLCLRNSAGATAHSASG